MEVGGRRAGELSTRIRSVRHIDLRQQRISLPSLGLRWMKRDSVAVCSLGGSTKVPALAGAAFLLCEDPLPLHVHSSRAEVLLRAKVCVDCHSHYSLMHYVFSRLPIVPVQQSSFLPMETGGLSLQTHAVTAIPSSSPPCAMKCRFLRKS